MATFKKKFSFKSTLCVVLGVLILAGSIVGLATLSKRGTDEIGASAFSVGGLDPETGKYVERRDTIYTSRAFSAQGLTVTPDFETDGVEYQIFFYDENDRFLEATERLSGKYVEQKLLPTYARIVIFPSTLDEEGNQIEDYKVGTFGVRSIAKSLTITVDADQDKVFSQNLFEAGENGVSAKMDIKGYDGLLLHLPSGAVTNSEYTVTFYAEKTDAEGISTMKELDDVTVTLQNYADGEYLWYTVEKIPAGATHATVTYYDSNVNVAVYGIDR